MKRNDVKISKRLLMVSQYITDQSSILDIGCDHALLDIFLFQNKKDLKIVVSDINEKPLENAKNNLKKYNLTKKIETRLGNGIDVLSNDIDTIIISGLGGKTMIDILDNQDKLFNVKNIVLSPNNDFVDLRKHLVKLGYFINNETLVEDNKIIYLVISFKKGKKYYTNKELFFGPILLKEKSKLFNDYFRMELVKCQKLLSQIPKKYFIKRSMIYLKIFKIKSNILK